MKVHGDSAGRGGTSQARAGGKVGADHKQQQNLEFWDHLLRDLATEVRSQDQTLFFSF